jgi:glycolate oxidase FAD binding subunit
VEQFAVDVGAEGAVCCRGGRTAWDEGGPLVAGVREVAAPVGVVAHEPDEMTVRVGAGTPVAGLQAALAEQGQRVLFPDRGERSTVGGVLAVGRADHRRLGWGPVRDRVLELRYVSAAGAVVKAGGPTVKNVSGFDLCRLLVGSLGTLGLVAEAVLRTTPLPEAAAWYAGEADPWEVARRLHRPMAVLWDGARVWVGLEGWGVDVDAQGSVLAALGLDEAEGPPSLPPHRWSIDPATLATGAASGSWGSGWVAEVGVGVVHAPVPPPARVVEPGVIELNRRVKERFDPAGRLAPGRDPMLVGA